MNRPKIIFGILCAAMILMNSYMHPNGKTLGIGVGIGGSLISIPIWSCIGVVLAQIGLFFYKILRPDEKEVLNIWQKASVGLVAGIILKPTFGILW